MTTNTHDHTATTTAVQRMAVQAYQLRHIADEFTRFEPGSPAYATCLASYFGEAIRLIQHAHQGECITQECATCNAIRVGLTGIGADLLVTRRLAVLAHQAEEQE